LLRALNSFPGSQSYCFRQFERKIIHCDMDAFYASVDQQQRIGSEERCSLARERLVKLKK
jgi:hypothetical protein